MASSYRFIFCSISFKNLSPFSSMIKNRYLCIQQGSLSIFRTPRCSRKSRVSAMSTMMERQLATWMNIRNMRSAQQLLNLEDVRILLQTCSITPTFPSYSAFSNSLSPITSCTTRNRPSCTSRLKRTHPLPLSFYRYSQLEFYITDSISAMIDRLRLGFMLTDYYTFSMLFFRNSGNYYSYSRWNDDCYCTSFSCTPSYACDCGRLIPRRMSTGSDLGMLSSKVLSSSYQNRLFYRRYRRSCTTAQMFFSFAFSFQYPFSTKNLFFSSTSFTRMPRGLSVQTSSLGLFSMLSMVPPSLALPSSSNPWQMASMFLRPLSLADRTAWFRQTSSSPKFLSYRWMLASKYQIQNWFNCTIELATLSACRYSDDSNRYLAWQNTRKGSPGCRYSSQCTCYRLRDVLPNSEYSSASKMRYFAQLLNSYDFCSNSSMTSMPCRTSRLSLRQPKIRLQAWLPFTRAPLSNSPGITRSRLRRARKAMAKKARSSSGKFLLSWKSRQQRPHGRLLWYIARRAELRYIRSISSLLTSSFLPASILKMRRLPGIFISTTTSQRLKRSCTANTPLDSFYLPPLFSRCASSRRQIERFCGLVFRPWNRKKVQRYYFLPKNDAYFMQQQAAASGRPTGSTLLAIIYCRFASRCQIDLIQIWAIAIILLQSPMEVSQIHLSTHTEPQTTTDLLFNPSEMNNFKEMFDRESLEKKKIYLQALQSHNNDLLAKIKQLDKQLNTEVDILSKKIVSPAKKRSPIPKIEEFETAELRDKFKQLQKIKHQLQVKRTGVDSLEFLLLVKEKYNIKLQQLHKTITYKTSQIAKLNKIKQKSLFHQNIYKQQLLRIGDFDLYGNQIDELRKKVKEKNQQIKIKKQQFLSMYNKNRSNKTFTIQPPLHKQQKNQQNDPELLRLKQQYLQMGKKIDLLKSKKNSLLKNTVNNIQASKQLDKLKQKYQNISKLVAK